MDSATQSTGNIMKASPTTPADIFSAIATLLSTLAAFFNNTFKTFAFALAALSVVLLLFIAIIKVHKGLTRRLHQWPLTVMMGILCVVSLGMSAWSLRHPANSAPSTQGNLAPVSDQKEKQSGPVYNSTTNGDNSPIMNGDNNVHKTDEHNEHTPKHRR